MGWLGDRYGVRSLLLVGAFLFIAGMMLTGIMSSLWQFYLFFGVILGVATTIFTVLTVSGVTLWFRRHLGIAMGVVWSFQGAGTIALLFLIGVAFNQLGMKWIFWLPGIGGGAILLLLVRFFYNGPGEIGLRPLGDLGERSDTGAPEGRGRQDKGPGIHPAGQTNDHILEPDRHPLLGLHGPQHHQRPGGGHCRGSRDVPGAGGRGACGAAGSRGHRTGSCAGRSGAVGLPDCVGGRHAPLQSFPLVLLFFSQDAWAFYLFAIPFGIGQSCEVPTFPIANRQYYGNVPQGSLYGWQNLGNGLGMGLAPVCAGFLWDVTGTYLAPLFMSLGFSLLALVSAWLLPSPRAQLIPDWESNLPADIRTTG